MKKQDLGLLTELLSDILHDLADLRDLGLTNEEIEGYFEMFYDKRSLK